MCTFLYGGNFAEEYALPFIIYSLYTFMKFIKNNNITYKEIALNGICLSVILLLKPNLISLWIVFIPTVMFIYIKNRRYKELGKTILLFLAGMIIVMLPIIIYFVVNNAFYDFIDAFLKFNLKYSEFNKQLGGISKTVIALFNSSKLNLITLVILIFNAIRLKINKKEYISQIILLVYSIITLVLISIAGRIYTYYNMILIPCYIIPITEILEYFTALNNKKVKIILMIAFVAIIICVLYNNVKNQVKEIAHTFKQDANINMDIVKFIEENSDENDNILVLGNNCNIYLKSNRRYDGKYMYQIPIITIDKKIADEIIDNIENNAPKIIIYIGDYKGFNVQKYTSPEELYENLTGKPKETIENEELYEILQDFVEIIKNVARVYERIENKTEDGIYEEKINDSYITWKLNKIEEQ